MLQIKVQKQVFLDEVKSSHLSLIAIKPILNYNIPQLMVSIGKLLILAFKWHYTKSSHYHIWVRNLPFVQGMLMRFHIWNNKNFQSLVNFDQNNLNIWFFHETWNIRDIDVKIFMYIYIWILVIIDILGYLQFEFQKFQVRWKK